jgi:predicted cupin superfamily sugar epimerase
MDARDVVERLGMQAHPEGGWFRETWRSGDTCVPGGNGDGRPAASAILYLLAAGEHSHWHRIDADEVWQVSAGGAIELSVWTEGDSVVTVHRLAVDLSAASAVQAVVPAGAWQAARPLGAWTLVGCIVAPGFEFDGFELAPPGWEPPLG